jgi:nitric oxide reductase subunit B
MDDGWCDRRRRLRLGWTEGNKLLEQPYPVKFAIVIVMLMFLYNVGMTIWRARRLTTTEGVLVAGLALAAILYLPALLVFDNYTLSIFYRWWTVHLWVEGVWEMIQAGLLAYLLIRLSGPIGKSWRSGCMSS